MTLLSEERWRRNQRVIVAMVFAVFTGFAFVLPFLTLYVQQLGVPQQDAASWAGVLIGVAPLLAGLLAPVWGRLAERHGHKPMALRALGSYVVLLGLSAAVTSVWQLLALRTGIGLIGGIGPLGLAMATAGAPRELTGKVVGMVQSAQILSAAVGPFLGGLLADTIGPRWTFLVASLLCAFTFVLVRHGYEDARGASGAPEGTGRLSLGQVLHLAGVAPLLVVLFLVSFVGRSFTPILPLHLAALGVPAGRLAFATGVLISAYSVAAALSAAVLGRATRRRSPRLLLALSLLGGAVTAAPMALVDAYGPMLVLAILLGLASGGALTLCYTLGGLMVPEAVRTTAFGFFSGAALFGGAVSPWVAGELARRWQLRGIYFVDAFLFVALALASFAQRAGTSAADRPEFAAASTDRTHATPEASTGDSA